MIGMDITSKDMKSDLPLCVACVNAKMHRLSVPALGTRDSPTEEFALISADTAEMDIPTFQGFKYYIVFICHCSRWNWVYLMKAKSDASKCFRDFILMCQTQSKTEKKFTLQCLRSDNEYRSLAFTTLCAKYGIKQEFTCSHTPHQNGTAERAHRTLGELCLSMLFHSGLPFPWWGEFLMTACYLVNRLPRAALGHKSPFEMRFSTPPDVSMLRVPGCVAYNRIPKHLRKKSMHKAIPLVHLGWSEQSKGWRLANPTTRHVTTSRDVIFDELSSLRESTATGLLPLSTADGVSDSLDDTLRLLVDDSLSDVVEPAVSPDVVPGLLPDRVAENELISDLDYGPVWEHARNDVCDVCDLDGIHIDLVLCEFCNIGKHAPCFNIPQRLPPEGPWACAECTQDATEKRVYSSDDVTTAHVDLIVHDFDCASCDAEGVQRWSSAVACNAVTFDDCKVDLNIMAGNTTNLPLKQWKTSVAKAFTSVLVRGLAVLEPKFFKQVEYNAHRSEWLHAIDVELAALERCQTWSIVVLPPGRRAISSKWVFKLKIDEHGAVDKFKARLVARGFTQVAGVDYFDTFAPVARMDTVRILLALACLLGWDAHHMDVSTAFLNGLLEEDIYMKIPDGLRVAHGQDGMVCKLHRSLYGLKQSGRAWNQHLHNTLKGFGFEATHSDPCLYVLRAESIAIAYLLVFVDDLLIIACNSEVLLRIKTDLLSAYKMTDLGRVRLFLNLCIEYDLENGILLIQQAKYTADLVARHGQPSARPISTPAVSDSKKLPVHVHPDLAMPYTGDNYRQLVGELLYLALASRMDISFSVSALARFNSRPEIKHWKAAQRVVRYLSGTINWGLRYVRDQSRPFSIFVDANYGCNLFDTCSCNPSDLITLESPVCTFRRSTSGYLGLLAGGAVLWRSKLQRVTAKSTSEAEYMAACMATQEALWVRSLFKELDVDERFCPDPTCLYEDNTGCIAMAENPVHQGRTKHIDIAFHLVKEAVQNGHTQFVGIPTGDQVADFLTKALGRILFARCRSATMFLID